MVGVLAGELGWTSIGNLNPIGGPGSRIFVRDLT
jgi:hypothetical protein